MSKNSKTAYFLITSFFFILFDIFFTKHILGWSENLPENPVFRFVFVENTGAAFSILQNSRLFLIAFSVFALCAILYYTIKNSDKCSSMALFFTSLLTAGIFYNMFERITLGYVIDYIKLNFISFPIFNLSDIFINIGVFAIVIIIIKNNYFKNNETDN